MSRSRMGSIGAQSANSTPASGKPQSQQILARNRGAYNSAKTRPEHGLHFGIRPDPLCMEDGAARCVRTKRANATPMPSRPTCARPHPARTPARIKFSPHAHVRAKRAKAPSIAAKLTRPPAVVSCPPQLNACAAMHPTIAAPGASSLIQRGGGTGPVKPRQPAQTRQVPTPAVDRTER